ncbi:MAG: energy transducer TonB [Xanthobacteraceae bacterium]|nr:energy transducer TonB [Xanthobacteraceae bacterium]
MGLAQLWKDPSKRVWLFGAIGALALHGAVAAVALSDLSGKNDDDVDLGAPGMEISFQLAAPAAEQTDLPPGPDTDASAASPQVVEQKAEIKPTDLPQDKPTEAEDPDRVVSPDKAKDPKEDDPTKSASQQTPSTESIAAEATATPSPENAQQSERSTTVAQGIGKSNQRIRGTWERELSAHFDRHKRYPTNRPPMDVKIWVRFELDRKGHIVSSSIVKGSGDPAFDEAALSMLKRSDPVPQPPPLVADEGLNFTLPVVFRVKGHG